VKQAAPFETTVEFEYIDLAPLYPPGSWKGEWKAPAGWVMDNSSRVLHGPHVTRNKQGVVTKAQSFRFGRLHGVEKKMAEDGRVERESSYDNGVLHGKVTSYQLKEENWMNCPVGGSAVTIYDQGAVVSHEIRAADGTFRIRAKADRITPAGAAPNPDIAGGIAYRGEYEEFSPAGKLTLKSGFVNIPTDEVARVGEKNLASFTPQFGGRRYSFRIPLPELFADGERTESRDDGTLRLRMSHRRGLASGRYESWSSSGKIEKRGSIEGGRPVGRWEWFYASGRPQAVGTYGSDGRPTGEWVRYGDSDNNPGMKLTGEAVQRDPYFNLWKLSF
jgi:antitoxin component YwqK of YwqJK toxin-antitoxin module